VVPTPGGGIRKPRRSPHALPCLAGRLWRRLLPEQPERLRRLLQVAAPGRVSQREQHGGPETLLKNALELRNKRSVQKYREMRRIALGPDDAGDTGEAISALDDAASGVARDLAVDRGELTFTQSFLLGAGPAAVGYVGGAGLGMLIAGPPGAFLGGLAGAIAPDILKPASDRLWGWVIDRLPFVSARKLLTTSARAEAKVGASLAESANEIWRRGYV
jgi:hypothetical protein